MSQSPEPPPTPSPPAKWNDYAGVALRWGGIVGAACYFLSWPPVLLTTPFYRRFRDEEKYRRQHNMHEWARFCLKHILGADTRVEGLERLPAARRGLMIISNHQSYADIVTVMGTLPIGAFLSKNLVAYIPAINLAAWLGGTIYFERKKPASRKKGLEDTLRMCEKSTPVVVFPEGTRSRDGSLREKLYPGSVHAAWERGLRVTAIALDGTYRVFPASMDRMRTGERVAVVVGDTFASADYPDRESFFQAAWQSVKRCHARAREMRLSPGWDALPRPEPAN